MMNDINELSELDNWFVWYKTQCEKYYRKQRQGELFVFIDPLTKHEYQDINEVDIEADIKALRVNELRQLIQTENQEES